MSIRNNLICNFWEIMKGSVNINMFSFDINTAKNVLCNCIFLACCKRKNNEFTCGYHLWHILNYYEWHQDLIVYFDYFHVEKKQSMNLSIYFASLYFTQWFAYTFIFFYFEQVNNNYFVNVTLDIFSIVMNDIKYGFLSNFIFLKILTDKTYHILIKSLIGPSKLNGQS